MGSCAHIREGCILEEKANGAHSVGLKHTILFPFVTIGSLINFCDCLMTGGTSRENHSEVGSSYIHFNFTPNQDKATPSLIGDVCKGVMLDQSPIFLGGQGGLVGPARLEYGTVIAAGIILRRDSLEKNKLITERGLMDRKLNYYPGLYWHIERLVINNINYIANLIALSQWYRGVRSQFFQATPLDEALYQGTQEKLHLCIQERIHRFKAFVLRLPESINIYLDVMKKKASDKLVRQKEDIYSNWPETEDILSHFIENESDSPEMTAFLEKIAAERKKKGNDYITVIQGIEPKWHEKGVVWLKGIVNNINKAVFKKIPSFNLKKFY